MCHNPNQTDAAYRTSGSEESIDFKRMVHGIHAGGFRKTPLIIIGRNGSVNNYSSVRFPSELRNCVKCHIDNGARGTFELPMSTTLGSTINSLSVLTPAPGQVDVDPSNDLRISPIAATCSGCHDKSETRQHMVRMGASFGVVQSALAGREQCVTCHGPGKSRDVRRAHEISQRSGSGDR
jgi:OmcA/MtrC family decaheme c-type cytochrome